MLCKCIRQTAPLGFFSNLMWSQLYRMQKYLDTVDEESSSFLCKVYSLQSLFLWGFLNARVSLALQAFANHIMPKKPLAAMNRRGLIYLSKIDVPTLAQAIREPIAYADLCGTVAKGPPLSSASWNRVALGYALWLPFIHQEAFIEKWIEASFEAKEKTWTENEVPYLRVLHRPGHSKWKLYSFYCSVQTQLTV